MKTPSVCAVVPAYNEQAHIAEVVQKLLDQQVEVVVVDDGSMDGTQERVRHLPVQLIEHSVNQGKGEAIRTGIRSALDRGFEAAVFLDADGQHVPEEIARFVALYESQKPDLVVGTRMGAPTGMPLIRKLSNRSSSLLVGWLAGTRVTDSQSGYRLLSRRAMQAVLAQESGGFELESEMIIDLARSGLKYAEVPISCHYGDEVSHYKPLRDASRFLKLAVRKGTSLLLRRMKNGGRP